MGHTKATKKQINSINSIIKDFILSYSYLPFTYWTSKWMHIQNQGECNSNYHNYNYAEKNSIVSHRTTTFHINHSRILLIRVPATVRARSQYKTFKNLFTIVFYSFLYTVSGFSPGSTTFDNTNIRNQTTAFIR